VDNLGGWLTTVVARICLDMLRTRESRREESLDQYVESTSDHADAPIEQEILLAESMSSALLIVLETLSPPERLAFVLHDLFAVPFDDIAQILDRSSVAARQLASRARRRVQGQTAASLPNQDRVPNREIVEAFLAASRNGDFGALLALLDPDVVMRVDAAAIRMGAAADVQGAGPVAKVFVGRAQAAEVAIVGDVAGIVWAPGGKPRVAFQMTIRGGKIAAIVMIADSAGLGIVRSLGAMSRAAPSQSGS
jgi:RNA polymerase sigma-70 factor (ECF subfamily)